MKSIQKVLADQTGALALDIPAGLLEKAKKFGSVIAGAFKSDDNKKWYEKTVGLLKGAMKYATMFGDALVGAFTAGGALISVGIGVATAAITRSIIKINSEMEQFTVSLQTTLGNLTAAKQEMAGIVQFAKETPYQVKEVTEAVVKLRAYAMDSDQWLKPLGNAASAFGRDITDAVEMAADAVQGQFRRALSYGLRFDKADFKSGGKYAGMTYAQALLTELNRRFKSGMELQAKTLEGIWSNIKDTLYINFQEATKPIYDLIKRELSAVYESMQDPKQIAKVKAFFQGFINVMYRIVSVGKDMYNYFKANILPILTTTGKAMLETFLTVMEMLGKLTKTVFLPILTTVGRLVGFFAGLISHAKLLIKIYVGYRVAISIFKLLAINMNKTAASMVAANKAGTMLSATVKSIGTRIAILGASIAGMWLVDKFMETRNNIKDIGDTFEQAAGGIEKTRDYLDELGNEFGFTVNQMTKAGLVAKEFGKNATNALEVGTAAASKAQEGYSKNLEMPIEEAVRVIGTLSESIITSADVTNEAYDKMRNKTQKVANMLLELNRSAEKTGLTMDNVITNFERYPDVLAMFKNNLEDLKLVMEAFVKAAKEGETVDLSVLFEQMSMLQKPSKEMLLNLPANIWISRTTDQLKDLNWVLSNVPNATAETASKMKEDAEFFEEMLDKYGMTGKLVENSQLKGAQAQMAAADKQIEAAEKQLEVASKASPGSKEGWTGKAEDWATKNWKTLAAALSGVVVAAYRFRKSLVSLSKFIGNTVIKGNKVWNLTGRLANLGAKYAGVKGVPGGDISRTWFGKRLVALNEKMVAKSYPKQAQMLERIEAATQIQTATIEKTAEKQIKALEKELVKAEKNLEKIQLGQVKSVGGVSPAKLKPAGMSAEEWISSLPKDMFKKLTEAQQKTLIEGEELALRKVSEIRDEITKARGQADNAIKALQENYTKLTDAFKKGRLPEHMRSLADEVIELTESLKKSTKNVAGATRGLAGKAGGRLEKATISTLFADPLFMPGLRKMFRSLFGDGSVTQRMASGGAGLSQAASSARAVETGNVVKRLESQWLRKQYGRIVGGITGPFKKQGIVAPGFQGFRPGEGEQWRFQKIIDAFKKSSIKVEFTPEQLSLLSENIGRSTAQATAKSLPSKLSGAISKAVNPAGWVALASDMDDIVKNLTANKGGAAKVAGIAYKYGPGAIFNIPGVGRFTKLIGTELSAAFELALVSPIKSVAVLAGDLFGGSFENIGQDLKDIWGEPIDRIAEKMHELVGGKDWDISKVTEAEFGIDVARYERDIEKIKDLDKKAALQKELDAKKLAFLVQRNHARDIQDENSIFYKKTMLEAALVERVKASNEDLVKNHKVSVNMIKGEWEGQLKSIREYVDKNITMDTQLTQDLVDSYFNGGKAAGEAYMQGISTSTQSLEDVMGGISEKDNTAVAIGIEMLKKMDYEYQVGAANLEYYTKKSNELEAEIEDLNYQLHFYEVQLEKVNEKMNDIASAFDLSIAINELELVSDKALGFEKEIARLNVELAKETMIMVPLQKALDLATQKYDDLNKIIEDAQSNLDKFMNAPIEGETAYQEALYGIDRQLNQLNIDLLKSQRGLEKWSKAGLTDTEMYKRISVDNSALQEKVDELTYERQLIELERTKFTEEVDHARTIAQIGEEMTRDEIMNGIKAAQAIIEANAPRLEQLKQERDEAQKLVDEEQKKIDKINEAINLQNTQLDLIKAQVEFANKDAEAARKKLDATKKIADIEAAITDQKMIQMAQDMAQGLISTDTFKALIDQYNAAAESYVDLTGKSTKIQKDINSKTFDKEGWDKLITSTTASQQTLTDNMNRLTEAIQSFIDGVDYSKVSATQKSTLEAVFGVGVADRIKNMEQYLGKLAGVAGVGAGIQAHAAGGVVNHPVLSMLAERVPEAVIPLQNGAVPVKFTGGFENFTKAGVGEQAIQNSGNTTVSIGDVQIIVRDDNDLEEVKKAILDLRQGQTNFFSRTSNYTERF